MASIRPSNGKFRVQLYVMGCRTTKVLPTMEEAQAWAADVEGKLQKRAHELRGLRSGTLQFPQTIYKARIEAPLTHEEIVQGATPVTMLSGIYFLIRMKRVIYVGQSVNVFRRLHEHVRDGMKFDSFTFNLCDEKDMDRLESTYIRALYPDDNIVLGAVARKRRSALRRFG